MCSNFSHIHVCTSVVDIGHARWVSHLRCLRMECKAISITIAHSFQSTCLERLNAHSAMFAVVARKITLFMENEY